MNEKPAPTSDPLSGLVPPGPPPELRSRVLAASRAALFAAPRRPDRWSLLWASRPLRLAWTACVLLLLAGHALLVGPGRPKHEATARPPSRSEREAETELAAIARLPRLDPDARSFGPGPGEPLAPAIPPGDEPQKENRT